MDNIVEQITAHTQQPIHSTNTSYMTVRGYELDISYHDENGTESNNTPSGAKLTLSHSDGRTTVHVLTIGELVGFMDIMGHPSTPLPITITYLRMLDSANKTMSEYIEPLMIAGCWKAVDDCCVVLRDINRIRYTLQPPVDEFIGVGELILDVDDEFVLNRNHHLIDTDYVTHDLLHNGMYVGYNMQHDGGSTECR